MVRVLMQCVQIFALRPRRCRKKTSFCQQVLCSQKREAILVRETVEKSRVGGRFRNGFQSFKFGLQL